MYPLKNNLKYVLLRMKSFKGTTTWFRAVFKFENELTILAAI